jgi:hypothetical protein
LVGKSELKSPLGRPWGRLVDNIKMDLNESVGGCGLDYLAPYREQVLACCNVGKNLRGLWNAGSSFLNVYGQADYILSSVLDQIL